MVVNIVDQLTVGETSRRDLHLQRPDRGGPGSWRQDPDRDLHLGDFTQPCQRTVVGGTGGDSAGTEGDRLRRRGTPSDLRSVGMAVDLTPGTPQARPTACTGTWRVGERNQRHRQGRHHQQTPRSGKVDVSTATWAAAAVTTPPDRPMPDPGVGSSIVATGDRGRNHPTVVITEDVNNDGTISNTEISGKVDVEVSLPGDAKAGDTVKVSGQADRLLTDADITAGKGGFLTVRRTATLTVTATIVDAAGNVSLPGSDSATMGDTTATGAPTGSSPKT